VLLNGEADKANRHRFRALVLGTRALAELFQPVGRPRLSYAKARALLEAYHSGDAWERVEQASGQAIRSARERLEDAQAIEQDLLALPQDKQRQFVEYFGSVENFVDAGLKFFDAMDRAELSTRDVVALETNDEAR